MKAVFLFVLGVFSVQSTFAQVIATAPIVATTPVIQSNNLATTLADTLSLLTVSSLLSEKLPFDYPCGCRPYMPPTCASPCAPYEVIAPIAPLVSNCGCGCNGYGYPYNAYPYVL